jgi:MFS family permease
MELSRRNGRFLRLLGLPGFRLLFLSTSASSFGTLLAAVALAVDVKDRTDSGLWVGALMIVEFLPMILIGLAFGPLLDRLSRRTLMIVADVARAAVFCALPFAGSAAGIVALATVAGLANGFFRPAAYAGVPNLVPDEDLAHANSLIQGAENVSWTIAPVLGGVLTAAVGPHAAYWINAATFVVSALLIARIPRRLLQSAAALTRGYWRDLGDGFAIVRRSRPLVVVLVSWSIAMVATGLANVAEVFLAKDSFDAGDFGYGLLFGAIGAGLVLGSFGGAPFVERFGLRVFYGFALAVMGVGYGLTSASPNVWIGAVFCVVAGIGNGGANLANLLLVQRGTSDAVRGRALTVVMSVNYVVLGLSMGAAGPAVDVIGARWTWATAAGVLACAAALALALGRGAGLEVDHRRVELELSGASGSN